MRAQIPKRRRKSFNRSGRPIKIRPSHGPLTKSPRKSRNSSSPRMLGRLRLDSQGLRGRRFPEAPHPYRNDFQRDRDRVIHSRAFRRLEGKTQVFAAGLCDHFRNRLTHTIEVSQIARTVAVALDLNEEYTETLALAHDLGHPPFAHVGEKELDRQMRKFGDSF